MPKEQERDLIRRAQAGDLGARDDLVAASQRLVRWVALKYVGLGATLEDMLQEGNLHLIRGIQDFDLNRGVRFVTYASWWVRRGVLKAVEDARMVRSPHRSGKKTVLFSDYQADFRDSHRDGNYRGKVAPTADYPDFVSHAIEQKRTEDESDPREELLKEKLSKAVSALRGRDRKIVEMRFGLGGRSPMVLSEIGSHLGISGEMVRMILKRVMDEMRWRMEE